MSQVPPHRARWWSVVVMTAGFLLSPLTWWNDIFINLPLAIALAWPLRWLWPGLFEAGVAAAFVLTNVLGLWLMHVGARGLVKKPATPAPHHLMRDVLLGVLYAVVVGVLVRSGLLPLPGP